MLLMAGEQDPLFLQIKEARPSVLEPYAGKSLYPNHGQRVVNGCRMMQSASDLFLGWTEGPRRPAILRPPTQGHEDQDPRRGVQPEHHDAVCRIMRLDTGPRPRPLRPTRQDQRLPGKSDKFDQAIADFSIAYADQSERDHKVLMKAVRDGRLKVEIE